MTEILYIKTSSLGDVIHHMPAITDARRFNPDAHVSWVVEELFAPLARLHPLVDRVIPVAARRWRSVLHLPSTWREIGLFVRSIRARSYDAIIDTQGLVRTAVIGRIACGPRHGYDADSIRESFASRLYDVRHKVDRSLHAIARNRILSGLALGYQPEGAIDYGLNRAALAAPAAPYGILLHATSRRDKEWPEDRWIDVGRRLAARDVDLLLPWGNAAERGRSVRLADNIPRARVPDMRPLDQVARLVAGAQFVIGVDTGLLHLAAALGVPLVAIFIGSEPGLTGPMGNGPVAIIGGKAAQPEVSEVMAALDRIG